MGKHIGYPPYRPMGQSFIPRLTPYVAVEVLLSASTATGGPLTLLTLKIREGTITGPEVVAVIPNSRRFPWLVSMGSL